MHTALFHWEWLYYHQSKYQKVYINIFSQSIKKNKKAYQAKFDAQDKAYLNRVCLVWYDLILVVKIYYHGIIFEVPSNALTRLLPT